jgi:hypothetical protein
LHGFDIPNLDLSCYALAWTFRCFIFISFDLAWPYLLRHFNHVLAEEVILIFIGETALDRFIYATYSDVKYNLRSPKKIDSFVSWFFNLIIHMQFAFLHLV